MGLTSTSAGGFLAGFLEPMTEDRLGMRRGPAVGKHLLQTRVVRVQAEQEIMDVGPGIDAMTFGSRQDGVQHRGPRTGRFASQKEIVLAVMLSSA